MMRFCDAAGGTVCAQCRCGMAAIKCVTPGFWKISEEDMTSAHQMLGVMGTCSGMIDVSHAQRVCPVWNPCNWPNCVPPQRRACVYDAVFFGRNICQINVLSSLCLCTANSGRGERSSHLPVHQPRLRVRSL